MSSIFCKWLLVVLHMLREIIIYKKSKWKRCFSSKNSLLKHVLMKNNSFWVFEGMKYLEWTTSLALYSIILNSCLGFTHCQFPLISNRLIRESMINSSFLELRKASDLYSDRLLGEYIRYIIWEYLTNHSNIQNLR